MIRGCGSRKEGGLYLCTNSGPDGVPLADFLLCPTVPVTKKWMTEAGIAAIGVHHVPGIGLFDVVGVEHYPYWPCFFQEGRRYGVSRHIAANPGVVKKVAASESVSFIHARGHLKNALIFQKARQILRCPAHVEAHEEDKTALALAKDGKTCQWLLLEAMGKVCKTGDRAYKYQMPWGEFSAWYPHVAPKWQHAICLQIPMRYFHWEVVNDPKDQKKVEKVVKVAETSNLPVEVVEE